MKAAVKRSGYISLAAVKMRCCVKNCTNDTKKTAKINGITFHMFPKEQGLRNTWIEALGIHNWEPKERSAICSEHFKQDAFYETKCGLRKIRNGAVPTLAIESTEELEAPAALRVCRMCLAIDVKMHHITDFKLRHLYEEVTGIILNPEDRLPKMVCWECVGRLTSAKRFKDKALRCYSLLANKVNTENYVMTIRDVKAINRSRHKLQSTLIMKCFGNDDSDLMIRDDEIIKTEKEVEYDDNFSDDSNDNTDDMEPVVILQVMDEKIFVEKYPGFVSGDNKSLSKVYKEKKVKQRKCKGKNDKVKEVPVKEVQVKVSLTNDDTPSTTMDKYKNSSVRRRKTIDALDKSLFTITALTYDEQIAEVQARQASAAYRAAPHKCAVCYRGFHIRDRYDAHMERHTEQFGAYECFICKRRIKTTRALRKHLTSQHTEKYSCKSCPFATRNRRVAREHEKWHAGTKYQCPHCPSVFDKSTTCLGHIRIKHVSSYVCELCGYTFISQKGIDVHKRKHRLADLNMPLEGPYCAECDVRFVSEEAHARHLKLSSRHSSDDDPNRIRNDSHSLNTKRNGRVTRRIKRRPVVPSRAVNCEQCGIQLRNLHMYAQHFLRAHPEKNRTNYSAMKSPCMCEQCGKIFQSMAHLKNHMWVHTGEKSFKCDHCDKSFMQKTNLVSHMQVHGASRPSYECPVCGKHFAFSKNLSRHTFIHTGLRPFKCETCGKRFRTAGEQRSHVEHVHLKKPWPKRAQARAARLTRSGRLNMKYEETERE